MRYKIKDIPPEGRLAQLPFERALLLAALDGTEGDVNHSVAEANLELHRVSDEVFVRGEIRASLTLPCARCLKPTTVPLTIPIKTTFVPESVDVSDNDDPLDDADVETFDGMVLDLEPTLREQLILNLPLAPHCSPTCLGLCPVCGQDRNERDCGHAGSAQPSALGSQLERLGAKFPKLKADS